MINFRLDIFARVLNLDRLSQLSGAVRVVRRVEEVRTRRLEDAGTLDTILGLGMVKLVIIFPYELVILMFTIWNKT